MKNINTALFEELKGLGLPTNRYIVVASGPLGVRGLRAMADVDILVSDSLWEELSLKNEKIFEHSAIKLRLSENVEAMCGASFGKSKSGFPTITEQIAGREIIDGIPFQNILHALFFKRQGTREKDRRDVLLIESWLKENS